LPTSIRSIWQSTSNLTVSDLFIDVIDIIIKAKEESTIPVILAVALLLLDDELNEQFSHPSGMLVRNLRPPPHPLPIILPRLLQLLSRRSSRRRGISSFDIPRNVEAPRGICSTVTTSTQLKCNMNGVPHDVHHRPSYESTFAILRKRIVSASQAMGDGRRASMLLTTPAKKSHEGTKIKNPRRHDREGRCRSIWSSCHIDVCRFVPDAFRDNEGCTSFRRYQGEK
jgi:hypothetical protein